MGDGTVLRVSVVGGGVAGAATALSLLQSARLRGRHVDVTLFRGGGESLAPLVVTPECRSRLAALGMRIDPAWHATDIRAVEVIASGRREVLHPSRSGLWVVDGTQPGKRQLVDALAALTESRGARVIARGVDSLERREDGHEGGPMVIRASGFGARSHHVALACGPAGAERLAPRYRSPAMVPAAEARLAIEELPSVGGEVLRVLIAPAEGIDVLYLIPGFASVYACAIGPGATPAELCQALMTSARDGHLAEGFELQSIRAFAVPAGAGHRLVTAGCTVAGSAAFGNPLSLGISETLACATRAAGALIECSDSESALERCYVREGLIDLHADALAGAKALSWLARAGDRAPSAFVSAQRRRELVLPFGGGVLGLPSPDPRALLASARWAGLLNTFRGWLRPAFTPLPRSVPVGEPDLIYVVDDDPTSREGLRHFLEDHGARVVSFSDELALYSAVARRPPAAILLDVVLNWVDGLRLCEGLKQHPLTRDCRVIVMSGLDRPHIRQGALDAGAEAFFRKPLDLALLLQVLCPRPMIATPIEQPAALEERMALAQ